MANLGNQQPQFPIYDAQGRVQSHPDLEAFLRHHNSLVGEVYRICTNKPVNGEKNYFDLPLAQCLSKIKSPPSKAFNRSNVINYPYENGKTLLMMLCRYNLPQQASTLVRNGADINRQDNNGNTALMRAIKHKAINVIIRLIDGVVVGKDLVKCDLNLVNKDNKTALDLAFEHLSRSKTGLARVFPCCYANNTDIIVHLMNNGAQTYDQLPRLVSESKEEKSVYAMSQSGSANLSERSRNSRSGNNSVLARSPSQLASRSRSRSPSRSEVHSVRIHEEHSRSGIAREAKVISIV